MTNSLPKYWISPLPNRKNALSQIISRLKVKTYHNNIHANRIFFRFSAYNVFLFSHFFFLLSFCLFAFAHGKLTEITSDYLEFIARHFIFELRKGKLVRWSVWMGNWVRVRYNIITFSHASGQFDAFNQ